MACWLRSWGSCSSSHLSAICGGGRAGRGLLVLGQCHINWGTMLTNDYNVAVPVLIAFAGSPRQLPGRGGVKLCSSLRSLPTTEPLRLPPLGVTAAAHHGPLQQQPVSPGSPIPSKVSPTAKHSSSSGAWHAGSNCSQPCPVHTPTPSDLPVLFTVYACRLQLLQVEAQRSRQLCWSVTLVTTTTRAAAPAATRTKLRAQQIPAQGLRYQLCQSHRSLERTATAQAACRQMRR